MPKRRHPVSVRFGCGCIADRATLTQNRKNRHKCNTHGDVATEYLMRCENCDAPFTVPASRGGSGHKNRLFCHDCVQPQQGGRVISYIFACGHEIPVGSELRVYDRPRCPECHTDKSDKGVGVQNKRCICGCGVVFLAGSCGKDAKYCPKCKRMAMSWNSQKRRTEGYTEHGGRYRRPASTIPCSIPGCDRSRRDPAPGEDAKFIRYCRWHQEKLIPRVIEHCMPDVVVVAPPDAAVRRTAVHAA